MKPLINFIKVMLSIAGFEDAVDAVRVAIFLFKAFIFSIAVFVGYLLLGYALNALSNPTAFNILGAVIFIFSYAAIIRLLYETERDLRI